MHLTNYAVNKHSRMYVIDDEIGSKRLVRILLIVTVARLVAFGTMKKRSLSLSLSLSLGVGRYRL